RPSPLRLLQKILDLGEALALLFSFLLDLRDLQPCELIETDLEDRIGLHRVELEGRDQLSGRIGARFRVADDPERSIEVGVNPRETVEDVQALVELALLVLESARDHLEAEIQEVPADLRERQSRRLPYQRVRRR